MNFCKYLTAVLCLIGWWGCRAQEDQRVQDSLYLSAVSAYIEEDYPAAFEYLENLIRQSPQEDAAYYLLSLIEEEGNAPSAGMNTALEYAEKAVALNPEEKWYRIHLATIYERMNRRTEAAEEYRNLYRKDHKHLLLFATLCINQYLSVENYQAALEVYEELESIIGINEELKWKEIGIHEKMGDKEAMERELEALIQWNPRETRYLKVLAQLYIEQKNFKKALACYEKILKLEADPSYVYLDIADLYRKQDKLSKSMDYLLKGMQSESIDIDTKLTVLSVYFTNEIGRFKGEEKYTAAIFEILNQMHSDQLSVQILYSRYLMEKKDYPKAETYLKKILSADSTHYNALYMLVHVLSEQQKWEEVYTYTLAAAACYPGQALFWTYAAMIDYERQNYEKATEYALQALHYGGLTNETRRFLSYILGDSYFYMGAYEKCFQTYEKMLKDFPEDVGMMNNYAYFLSLRSEKLPIAQVYIEKALDKEPDNSTYLDTYAWVLHQQGKYGKALEVIEKAVRKSRTPSVAVLEHYKEILIKNSMEEKAGKVELELEKIKNKTAR